MEGRVSKKEGWKGVKEGRKEGRKEGNYKGRKEGRKEGQTFPGRQVLPGCERRGECECPDRPRFLPAARVLNGGGKKERKKGGKGGREEY